jgi:hypothetical protein
LAKPSPSPSAKRPLAKINGFIAANISCTMYNGQAPAAALPSAMRNDLHRSFAG